MPEKTHGKHGLKLFLKLFLKYYFVTNNNEYISFVFQKREKNKDTMNFTDFHKQLFELFDW